MHWEKSHETVSAVAGTSRTVACGRRPHDAVFLAIGTGALKSANAQLAFKKA